MAPLTWRNVAAPDFQGVASMMETASRGWDRAFTGLNEALSRQAEVNRRNRAAEMLPMLANVTDQASAEEAIAAIGRMAPHQISPELAAAVMGLRTQAQEFQANQLQLAAARRTASGSGGGSAPSAQDQIDAAGVLARAGAVTGQYPSGQPEAAPTSPSAGGSNEPSGRSPSQSAPSLPLSMGTSPLSFGSLSEPGTASETAPAGSTENPSWRFSERPTATQHTDLFGMGPAFRAGDMLARGLAAAGIEPAEAPVEPSLRSNGRPTATEYTELFGMSPTFRSGDMLARGLAAAGIDPNNPPQRAPVPNPVSRPQPVTQPITQPSTQLRFGQPVSQPAPQASVEVPTQPTSGYNLGISGESTGLPAPQGPASAPATQGVYAPQTLQIPQIPASSTTTRVPLSEELEQALRPILEAVANNPGGDPSDTLDLIDNTQEAIIDRRAAEDTETLQALSAAQASFNLQRDQIDAARGDAEFQRSEEGRLRAQEADAFVADNYLMFEDREALVMALSRAEDVDPQMRDAVLEAWDSLPSEMFNLPEPDPALQGRVEAVSTMLDADMESLMSRSPLYRAVAQTLDSEGEGGQTNLEFLNYLAEGEVPVDRAQVLAEINRLYNETGLDLPIIHAAVENSLVQGTMGWDGITAGELGVDPDRLRENLQAYSDPAILRDASQFLVSRRQEQARLETLGERLLSFDQRIRRLQENLPEAEWATNPALRAIEQDREAAQSEFDALTQQIEQVWFDPVPGFTPENTAVDQEEQERERIRREEELALQRALEAAAGVGAEIPTPRGYVVDPDASPANQAWNQFMRDAEIRAAVNGLQMQLNTYGSPENQGMLDFADFFRSSSAAQRTQAMRQSHMAARAWYETPAAMNLFLSNPALIEEARQDPVGFYARHMEAPNPR